MIATDPDDLEKALGILQTSLLMAQETQKKKGRECDFAGGFAMGVDMVTMILAGEIVRMLCEAQLHPVVCFVNTIRNIKELHEAGHVLNGQPPDCAGIHEVMYQILRFMAKLEREM